MSINLNNLKPEQIKKYIRTLSDGEMLFEQGQSGNTMFIIVSGEITLLEKRGESNFVVGTLAVGQVLGEKAMLTEGVYERTYSARANGNVTLLEFDNKNLRLVEQIIPNFTSRILQIAAKRLDRANKVITLLRSMDPIERVINALYFMAMEDGKSTAEGTELKAGVEDVAQVCHVPQPTVEECLEVLTRAKVIEWKKEVMFIRDLNALTQYLPELKDRIAA